SGILKKTTANVLTTRRAWRQETRGIGVLRKKMPLALSSASPLSPEYRGEGSKSGKRSWRIILLPRALIDIDVIDEADHHFLPGLIPPADYLRRVGVVEVLLRVVEVGGTLDARARGQFQRRLEAVVALPVEVVTRHSQRYLRLAVRVDDVVLEVLA